MAKFAVHVNSAGATFVKDYDFFVEQGGEKERWGRAWKIVEADDIHGARVAAISLPDARSGLYCAKCGHTRESCECQDGPTSKAGERPGERPRRCTVCEGMAHRRDKPVCSGCGKPWEPETIEVPLKGPGGGGIPI